MPPPESNALRLDQMAHFCAFGCHGAVRASVQSVIFLHILLSRHSVVEEVVGVARVIAKIVVSHAVKPVLA